MDMNTAAWNYLNIRKRHLGFAHVLLLLLAAAACSRGNLQAAAAAPAPEIGVTAVIQQDVPVFRFLPDLNAAKEQVAVAKQNVDLADENLARSRDPHLRCDRQRRGGPGRAGSRQRQRPIHNQPV